jgi:hypothetical protein
MPFYWIRHLILVCCALLSVEARAQAPSPTPAVSDQQLLKPGELDALVAPIALYPDALLAEVLMASTYPLEVVEAERWVAKNGKLGEDQLKSAADKQAWDNSVKSLVATPSVLTMMSTHLDWTQKLGDAVLAQQSDVMGAIQRMRSKAYENKKLTSTKEQTVTVAQEENKPVIRIEPTVADVVSVPYYDPAVVYGDWPYPDYPPYYFAAPDYIPGGIIATGIAFGAGYLLGRWTSGGNYWGGGVHWGRGDININRPINIDRDRVTHWQHNPQHRRGVQYRNANVQQRFGNSRGRSGEALRPDRARTGAIDRSGVNRAANLQPGNRPGHADRGGKKGGAKGAGASRPASAKAKHASTRKSTTTARARRPQAARAHSRSTQYRRSHASASRGSRSRSSYHRRGGGRQFVRRHGGARGGGHGRRSDMRLKHHIVHLGRLNNGLGYYRFAYHGSDKAYVGVLAQEVQTVSPSAIVRGRDGYLWVLYSKLGLKFQTYDRWMASGAHIPVTSSTPGAKR